MHYLCISFTHKNTDIALREKLSLSNETKKKEILRLIKSNSEVLECLVISTCNRVEILAYVGKLKLISDYIISSLALICDVDKILLKEKVDIFEDSGALHHLFSVASSLDSLVVGETQIVGQLKDAYYFALKENFCANHISLAIKFALKCAANIRNKTQISKNPISVASVAVSKAKELLNLSQKQAIVIGAGDMSELVCKHLLNNKISSIIILNRDLQKAQNLANQLGNNLKVDSINNIKDYLNNNELFFSATNANNTIINDNLLEDKDFIRYFFDIAVPRDIDLNENEKIKVFSVDDLKEVVSKNLALRENEAQIAYSIISSMINEFFMYLNNLSITPIIKAIRLKAKECAKKELDIAIKKGYLKKSDELEAEKLIHQVFKSFLHQPTINLKKIKANDTQMLDGICYLFDIENKLNQDYKIDLENDDEI